jgi:hypothetical protein
MHREERTPEKQPKQKNLKTMDVTLTIVLIEWLPFTI